MTTTSGSAASNKEPLTPLRSIANLCNSGGCPTIYTTGSDRLVVQGYPVSAEQLGVQLAPGEALVEIPAELVAEAVRNLG